MRQDSCDVFGGYMSNIANDVRHVLAALNFAMSLRRRDRQSSHSWSHISRRELTYELQPIA